MIRWERDGTAGYARAVNPREGQEPYEEKFARLLRQIGEDAWGGQNWCGTVDGSLSPEEAAVALAALWRDGPEGEADWVSQEDLLDAL